MNIIEAIKDEQLFRPFLQDAKGSIKTWLPWMAALRVLYGIGKVDANRRPLAEKCTGRNYDKLPATGFDTALFLTGRRSGKSRVAAIVGAFEATLAGTEKRLAKGETGLVAITSPTKLQSRIVTNYLRAIFETPLLKPLVEDENRDGFTLTSGVRIEIQAGDFRSIRGYTLLAAICDEIAFFGLDESSAVKSDAELIRAIKPGLGTTGGKLICISSPYARKGWCYSQHKRNFGNNRGKTLVWNAPSRMMNETLPQSVVDDALAEDFASAKAEYLGEFRDDVGAYISRALIESLVVPDRLELLPKPGASYCGFVDLAGGAGGGDDAALCIAHAEGRKVIVDLLRRYRPPFSPTAIVGVMAAELQRYGIRRVTADNWSSDFARGAFASHGIAHIKCDKPKSALYLELLPRLCSDEIELLDNETLISQLAGLERRTRSGGKDSIDHCPGAHDDIANALAGVAVVAAERRIKIGSMFPNF